MRSAAIICEYNPFHQGHKYHIEETRRLAEAECIIAIMSGCFVQRGEPAIQDEQSRAQQAIAGGADLVMELPYVYACSGVYIRQLHNQVRSSPEISFRSGSNRKFVKPSQNSSPHFPLISEK